MCVCVCVRNHSTSDGVADGQGLCEVTENEGTTLFLFAWGAVVYILIVYILKWTVRYLGYREWVQRSLFLTGGSGIERAASLKAFQEPPGERECCMLRRPGAQVYSC